MPANKKKKKTPPKTKRVFDSAAANHFIDSVDLIFNKDSGTYSNVTIYDGADNTKSFANVTDAKNAKTKSLLVVIEATHDGKTKNFTEYVADKMEKSTPTWTNPFNKPVLKNHNSYSGDPLGRTIKAEFGESITHPGSKTIFLTMEISDADAIEKFLDGRYLTVSIGARVKELTCQICEREILKDGFCGHWAGNKYKKKTKGDDGTEKEEMVDCYWTIGECEYYEVSVVNSPADTRQTGPLQMTKKIEAEDDDDSKQDGQTEESEELKGFASFIDSEEDDENDDDSDEDDSDEDDSDKDDSDEDDSDEDEGEEKDKEENSLKIKKLENKLSAALSQNELLKTTNSTIEIENTKLTKENQELKDTNKILGKQIKTRTDQFIKLGRQFRDTLVSGIGTLGHTKTDAAVYAEKTITDIKKEFDNTIKRVSKVIPKTSSPGLANNNADGVDPDSENSDSNKDDKPKTLQDYTNKIINKKNNKE